MHDMRLEYCSCEGKHRKEEERAASDGGDLILMVGRLKGEKERKRQRRRHLGRKGCSMVEGMDRNIVEA